MQSRIDKLCEKMHDNEAVFISSYPNIFYYSGFTSEDAYLLISHSGKYIITDSRYTIQAREQAKGFEVIDIAKGFEKRIAKGKMDQAAADSILAKITTGTKEICTDCDLIVEAAFENMEVKKTTFGELDKICKPECVFASNTSSLSITEIGNGLTRPLIGMHFFNPADRMKLVEVIAGVNTPAETVDTIKKISEEIGKTPVQVNEAAGFVVNRILIPMINEAAFIKMEGVSDIAGIDAAMKLGANHPMGPLELGDFVGLDICLAIMDVLYNETGDSKYRACPLLRKMVRGGNLGCKTGKGFYVYNADRTKTPVDAQ